jgi:uncharacterized protein YjbI with pentapeptide repeats
MPPRRRSIKEDYEELFLSPDPNKDADTFWEALRKEYVDEEGSWDADWSEFVFPDQMGEPFALATFSGPADFTGATFLGRAVFGGKFVAPASFRRTRFCKGAHFYLGTVLERYADFSEALFCEDAIFSGVRFLGATNFHRAIFRGDAIFYRATFGSGTRERLGGAVLMAAPPSQFSLSMSGARFRARTTFEGATFAGSCSFHKTAFQGPATFEGAEVQDIRFEQARVERDLTLGLVVTEGGSLLISEPRSHRKSGRRSPAAGPPTIRFGRMSLVSTELRSLSAAQADALRFNRALDIDRVSLTDVAWPERQRGYLVGDESDIEAPDRVQRTGMRAEPGPSVQELERIYRSLRKNFEDRHDRVGAHRWYFAEMDVGRRHGRWTFTKLARWFYWLTSGYGLAPVRPLVTLLLIAALTFGLYMVPSSQVCPFLVATGQCAGWPEALKVVLLGISFQGLPSGLSLPGVLSNLVWVLARVASVSMLVSIGVAFRNQIAR